MQLDSYRNEIDKRIAVYKKTNDLGKVIFDCIEVLASTNKNVSKKFQTAVMKALPNCSVYYENGNFDKRLYVWGNGIDYDERMMIHCPTWDEALKDVSRYILDKNPIGALPYYQYLYERDHLDVIGYDLDKIKAMVDKFRKDHKVMRNDGADSFAGISYPLLDVLRSCL